MKNVVVRKLTEDELIKWDQFVDSSPQGNIFNKSFWLKLVSEDTEYLVCEENGTIIGGIALPNINKKFYRNPKLTPQLGVLHEEWNPKIKYSTYLSREMDVQQLLIDSLPKNLLFDYTFSYQNTSLLPFIWGNYDITPKYTYIIEDLTDLNKIQSNFQYDVKYQINRAKKNELKITSEFSIDEFYDINKKSFDRQNISMPYSLEFIKELDQELAKRNSRKMLFATNNEGKIIGGAYVIYDEKCCYYLMGGADPEYRKMGTQTFLIWEAIQFAAQVSKNFDFEGSMIPSIESYFRQFGGSQKIIFNVSKSSKIVNNALKFARNNRELVRKIFKV